MSPHRLFLALAAVLALTTTLPAQEQEKKTLYDESADGATQIAEALAEAKKENKRVLIQWGANWCGWCHILEDQTFKGNRGVARKLMYEYEVVHLDIGRGDKHLELAEKFGADFKNHGVPYLTIVDADGKVLLNQETGALEKKTEEGESGHDPEKILAILEKHQAPYRAADSILNEGLALAREENKLAFVHFGAPWCGWCHRLEDWMALPAVAKVLGREFVDIKIDTDRTIGGSEIFNEATGGARSGIPFFVFMDGEGNTVVNSFVEGKNLGCPWTDEEKSHFRALLSKVRPGINEKELDTILALLGPQEEDQRAVSIE